MSVSLERMAFLEGEVKTLREETARQHEVIKELTSRETNLQHFILNKLNIMATALENLQLAETSIESVLGSVIDNQLKEIADLKQQVANGTISEQSVQDVADKLNAFKDKMNAEVNPPATGS